MKMQKVAEKHQGFFMNSCSYAVVVPSEQLDPELIGQFFLMLLFKFLLPFME